MASPQNKHAQDRPSNNARRLALRYTQPFNLDDWQKAQSAEREQLLHDFDFRRSLPDVPILQHIRPASGNGDVATDVSIARRHYAMTGERLLLEVVKDVYDVMDLYCGFVDFPPRAEDFTKPYCSSAPNHCVQPWDQLVKHIGPSAQTVTQLEEERTGSLHLPERHEVEEELYLNRHMMVIINARGTVLLNRCFHGTLEQKKIIKLAILALNMWNTFICQRSQSQKDLYGMITEKEWRRLRMTVHLLPLIRDDVQKYLYQAVQDFSLRGYAAQKNHMDILNSRLHVWPSLMNVRAMSYWDKLRSPGTREMFQHRVEDLRTIYETRLTVCAEDEASRLVQQKRVSDTGIPIHFTSEYIGAPLSNGDDQQTDRELIVPWMKRREDRFWFRC